MQRIEIFTPGWHTAMSGETLGFSEQQLRESAAAYDPNLHEAPLVVGHPSHDHPAYGWVKSLEYGQSLEAIPDQVEPQFAELVESGRFKKVSASFYRPDSPSNPKPGVYYLRHIGFLGAQPPAIKGLKQIEFADGDSDVVQVEFGEAQFGEVRGGVVKRLFRSLREIMIADKGLEAADRALPSWDIDHIEDPDASSFSENRANPPAPPHQPTPEVIDVDKQELDAREARLKQQEAEFAEREQQHRAAASASLVDDLVKQGRVLPKHRDGLVAFMASQDAEGALEFGEGSDKVKTTGRGFLEDFLKELPVAVDYAERGAGGGDDSAAESYRAPEGYHVDPDKARLHNQALAYQERNECDYVTAIRAVQRGTQA